MFPPARSLIALLGLVVVSASAQQTNAEGAIRGVLEEQQAAWNRGDVKAFMSGYEASEATTFVGAAITHGYKQVLENYHRRYPTKERMGQLTFSGLEVRLVGPECAAVIGKWNLERPVEAGGNVGGIFTLVFRKTASGWKIILDHTS